MMRRAMLLLVAVVGGPAACAGGSGGGGDDPGPSATPSTTPTPATPRPSATPRPTPSPTATIPDPVQEPRPTPVPGRTASLDLGTVDLGADGIADDLTFTLPDDVQTFTVVIGGEEDGVYLVRRLTGPGDAVIVTDQITGRVDPIERFFLGPFGAQFRSPNRVVQDEVVDAALFPNNPGVRVTGGDYHLEVQGVRLSATSTEPTPLNGDVDVEVIYKAGAVAQTTGRVPVNLYFTGAGGIDAAEAQEEGLMQDALDHLRRIYRQAHIEIDVAGYHDIDGAFRTIEGVQGPDNELNRLFTNSRGHGTGLHYFFVDRFEVGGPFPSGAVGGIAGGLPGPPLRDGTEASGVAVSLAAANRDPAVVAHVMAHEGGHWLGLFHTVELIGPRDQMPDTPEGDASSRYLMYPAVGGGQLISRGQAQVMRHHVDVTNDAQETPP